MARVGGGTDKGFDLGPAEFYVSREQPGRNTKWAFGVGGRGLRLGCVIREPLSTPETHLELGKGWETVVGTASLGVVGPCVSERLWPACVVICVQA